MAQHPPLNLLDLPREILIQIIEPFLTTRPNTTIPLIDPGDLWRRGGVYNKWEDIPSVSKRPSVFAHPVDIISILLIHPIVYNLSIPILYRPNHIFVIDTSGAKHSPASMQLREAVTSSASIYTHHSPDDSRKLHKNWLFLRNITSIKLVLERLRGWTKEYILPLLQRLILEGSLEHLHVHFRQTRDFDFYGKLAQGAPLRAFIDLLADPDLKSARFTLSGSHSQKWCPFHEQRECGDSKDEVGVEWWRLAEEVDKKGDVAHVCD